VRILIIDDDEDLRNLLRHYLKQHWADAEVDDYDPLSRDLPDAKFPLGSYDVVILDYMLGRGDGLDWLQKLKRRADCPKILFLTGAGNEIIAVRAMKAGADDYQRKQEMTRERLISSIQELTASAIERTVSPELAARMEGHSLGAKVHIPGIKVLHLIGEGGTARVYLASRERDDEPLVVKILRPEITSDKTQLARFMEEYTLVERIKSPHVARIYDHGNSGDQFYLVMEFFEGGDLNKRLASKALPPPDCLRLFRDLMFALGDIHEKGILHRDLKPQNLMFRNDGSLAIVDFGIAKHVDGIDRTGRGEVLGTPRYMSPEQVQGRALDLRTDIYSAGVLLFQMLTGRHLFDGETAVEVALHHINTPPPPLPDELEAYQRLIDKLVEKDRDARFRNSDEVIGFLSRKFFQLPALDVTQKLPVDVTQKLH
jgi:DNA-binding NarL/FixJ family response regulator/tRNA A-37 threonylcarbamoyl transferase component Bud32